MRVVLVSPYAPQRDGLAGYAARLRADLLAGGDDVVVVAARSSDREEVIGDLATHRVEDLAARILAWRPDVVHVQHTIAGYGTTLRRLWPLISRLRAWTAVPVVVTHHEVTRDVARIRSVGRAYYRWISRRVDVAHLHTTGAAALHDAINPAGPRAVVYPHPVAALPAATVTPAQLRSRFGLGERPVVLSFGFVHVDKGLDIAVRAVAQARAAGVDPVLVVAGEVRRRPLMFTPFEWVDRLHLVAVRRLAARLGVALTVTGYVPDAAVAAWFDVASVVLLPYRRAEQSGVAQLAVAAGAQVLAAPTGGLVDLFAGTGALVDAATPAAFGAALSNALRGQGAGTGAAYGGASFAGLRALYPVPAADAGVYTTVFAGGLR